VLKLRLPTNTFRGMALSSLSSRTSKKTPEFRHSWTARFQQWPCCSVDARGGAPPLDSPRSRT
jgi:hypothetical protein